MKNILVFLVFILFSGNIYAQKEYIAAPPDYDAIKDKIQDATSPFYYPLLTDRLNMFDTTLTYEDYKYLYYGYVFQNEYKPYGKTSTEDELIKHFQQEEIPEKSYHAIIKLALQSLKEFPFSMQVLDYLSYIYYMSGNDDMFYKSVDRFDKIFSTIVKSGDGLSTETAFHVISIEHEYALLDIFELEINAQMLINGGYDYLELKENAMGIDGIYFNIKKIQERNAELMNFKE